MDLFGEDADDAEFRALQDEWRARRKRLEHFDPSYVMAEPLYLGPAGREGLIAKGAEFEVLADTLFSLVAEAGLEDLAERDERFDAPLWSVMLPNRARVSDDRHPAVEEWVMLRQRDAGRWSPHVKVLAYDAAGVVIMHRGPGADDWRHAFFWALEALYEADPRAFYSERGGELHKREYLLALLRELQRAYEAAHRPLTVTKQLVLTQLPQHETMADRVVRTELAGNVHRFPKLTYFVGLAEMPLPDARDMDDIYGGLLAATYAALRPTLERLAAPADAKAIEQGRLFVYEYLGIFDPPHHAVPARPFHVYHVRRFPDAAYAMPVGVGLSLRYWETGRLGDLLHRSPAAAQFFFIAALAQLVPKEKVTVGTPDKTPMSRTNRYMLQNLHPHYFAAFRRLLALAAAEGKLVDPTWAQLDKKGLCERATALVDTPLSGQKRTLTYDSEDDASSAGPSVQEISDSDSDSDSTSDGGNTTKSSPVVVDVDSLMLI